MTVTLLERATVTLDRADALALVNAYVEVLNAKEVARRAEEVAAAQTAGTHVPTHGASAEQYAKFTFKIGKRYAKIIMNTGGQYGTSVHSFVDVATGDVLKAAGWSAPAPGVRFRLATEEGRARLFAACEWSGGYLYVGAQV